MLDSAIRQRHSQGVGDPLLRLLRRDDLPTQQELLHLLCRELRYRGGGRALRQARPQRDDGQQQRDDD